MNATPFGHSLRSSIAWLGSTTVLWQLWSWFVTLFTARLLTPADYGVLALAESVLPYLTLIANLGITHWVVQARRIDPADEREAFSLSLLSGTAVTAAALALTPWISAFYGSPDLERAWRLLSLCFIMHGVSAVPLSLLRREMNFKLLGIGNLCVALLRSSLQLLLAYLGYGYMSLVLGILFAELAEAAWLFTARPVKPALVLRARHVRRILAFGVPATGAAVCGVVLATAPHMVIGKLFGVEALGYYAMAFYLSDLPLSKLNLVLRPIALSYWSKLQSSHAALRREFLRTVRGVMFVVFPIFVGVMLTAPEGVPLLLGPRWEPLVPALQLLCVVGLLRAAGDNTSLLFLALGRPQIDLLIGIVNVALLPLAFFLFALRFGSDGIYAAWLTVYPALLLLTLFFAKRLTAVSVTAWFRNLLPPAAAAAGMAVLVLLADLALDARSGRLLLAVKIGVGVISYAALSLITGREQWRALIGRHGPPARVGETRGFSIEEAA